MPLSGSFCGIPISAPRGTNHAGYPNFSEKYLLEKYFCVLGILVLVQKKLMTWRFGCRAKTDSVKSQVVQYAEIFSLEESILDLKIKNRRENTNCLTPNYLLFVEHPHVYTLGKSGDVSNILLSEKELESKGAKFYKINRGGDVTYHGPGQIVGYPILDF